MKIYLIACLTIICAYGLIPLFKKMSQGYNPVAEFLAFITAGVCAYGAFYLMTSIGLI